MMNSIRSFIAAHCRNCGHVVTCRSSDVLDDVGNPVLDEQQNVQQTDVLTGRCDACGATAEVRPYTPVPFSGHPIDPRAPRMAAHVGPFGAVPTADALRPGVPTGLTTQGSAQVPTPSGVGAPAPATVAETQAGPAEGVPPLPAPALAGSPQENTSGTQSQPVVAEPPAYAPVQAQTVDEQAV